MQQNQRFALEQAIERNPLIVTPDTPLFEVINLMSLGWVRSCHLEQNHSSSDENQVVSAHSSYSLVMQDSQVTGIFTERDMMQLLAAGRIRQETTIAEVMSTEIVTLKATDIEDVFTVLSLTCDRNIRHLPIVDEQNQLLGIITPEGMRKALHPTEWLRFRRVAEVMNTRVLHAPPTISVLDAIKLMVEHHASCVVIVRGNGEWGIGDGALGNEDMNYPSSPLIPIGILTERDIIQFQKLELNLEGTQVQTVMSSPLCLVNAEESLWAVHRKMQQYRVRRLVIADRAGELRGIVTETSLLQALDPTEMYGVLDLLQQKVERLEVERSELSQSYTKQSQLYQQVQTALEERKQIEKTLREERNLTSAILDVAGALIVVLDKQEKIVSFNQACERTTGYSFEEVENNRVWNLIPPEEIETTRKIFEQLKKGEYPKQHQNYLIAKDGSRCLISWSNTCLIDDDGLVKYIIATGIDITQKHQVEEDFNRFFSLSLDMLCVAGFDGYFKQINPAFEEILGYTKAELFAQSFLNIIHPDDIAPTLAEMDKLSQGVKTIGFENRLRCKNGSYKWLQWNGIPYEQLFYAVARDVTERKQMQLDIQESEKRYRYIYENTPVMLHSIDSYGNLISVSNFWLEKLGYKRHEVLGHKSTEFLTPESQKYARQALPEYFHKGFCQNIPYQFIKKDGQILDILLSAIAERDADGNIIRSLAVLIDVTESNKAKQKIQEQATLLDVATDAIMVRDLDNQILYWNQGAERLYGFTSAEALGQNADKLLYRNYPSKLAEIHQALLKKDYWKGELQQVTKAGNDIIVLSTWNLVREEHGNHKSTLIVNTDITEKKQLEAQFLRAQRLESIGTLSGGIAHDLNNILTPILAISQLLPLTLPSSDEQTKHLFDVLETSAKRGATLVKQVLSFARGVQGDRTPLQVKHIISEIKDFARNTFPKSIEIQVALPDDLRLISADATQIHQVLMNLCVNARDAMSKVGTLSLKAENIDIDQNYAKMNLDANVGNYVVITVTDTGTGIPPETLERIFEPFFTTKEQGKGTGLGLSTTIGIIKSHGGFINVYSEVGEGTKFQVYLPAIQTAEVVKDEKLEIPKGEGELILIADDEISVRDITKASLENYNYQVITASDGIEAIALYAQHKNEISAVLMDMMMPEMDGVTTIRTLQRMNPQVKIIAVSGLATSDKVSAAINNGAKLFLSKPYTSEELLVKLHQVINLE
jgi:PAS domain S-box-containing protein